MSACESAVQQPFISCQTCSFCQRLSIKRPFRANVCNPSHCTDPHSSYHRCNTIATITAAALSIRLSFLPFLWSSPFFAKMHFLSALPPKGNHCMDSSVVEIQLICVAEFSHLLMLNLPFPPNLIQTPFKIVSSYLELKLIWQFFYSLTSDNHLYLINSFTILPT